MLTFVLCLREYGLPKCLAKWIDKTYNFEPEHKKKFAESLKLIKRTHCLNEPDMNTLKVWGNRVLSFMRYYDHQDDDCLHIMGPQYRWTTTKRFKHLKRILLSEVVKFFKLHKREIQTYYEKFDFIDLIFEEALILL
jgi:hypothetical protein